MFWKFAFGFGGYLFLTMVLIGAIRGRLNGDPRDVLVLIGGAAFLAAKDCVTERTKEEQEP
jgi:hypothetical protein